MKPYVVIGHYRPKRRRGSIIGPAILSRIAHLNLVPKLVGSWGPQTTSIWHSWPDHAEVRRFVQPSGQGGAWHQDGDLEPNSDEIMNHAAVLWADSYPTEFKTPDGMIHRPEPFEIVIASNLACHHRSPADAPAPPTRRWFFRQRVEVPSFLVSN